LSWSLARQGSRDLGRHEVAAAATIIAVEARAAVAAARRAGRLTNEEHRAATLQLNSLLSGLTTVHVTRELISEAADLSEAEALRAYDAVHLAAALLVRADVLTNADKVLCDAASRRGLRVAIPLG
jgi:uncharacterized protein